MYKKEPLDEEQDENELETSDDAADEESAVEKASPAARKLEPTVLAHLLRPNYQPVKPRVIAKQLKLPSEQYRALNLCIKRLVQQGKAAYGRGHLVRPVVAAGQKTEGSKASGGRVPPGTQPPDTTRTTDAPQPSKAADATPSVPAKDKTLPASSKYEVIGKFRRAAAGFGFVRWYMSVESQIAATSGQVMFSALPILLGFQLLISAVAFDIGQVPVIPLHVLLSPSRFRGLVRGSRSGLNRSRIPAIRISRSTTSRSNGR